MSCSSRSALEVLAALLVRYFYISGSTRPFTWDIASVDVIDIDQTADVDRASSLNIGYKIGTSLGSGEMLSTGNSYLATDTGSVGVGTTSPDGKLHVKGISDDQQLIVQGYSTQTSNLQEWKNSAGTLLGAVSGTGNFGIGASPITNAKMKVYNNPTDSASSESGLYVDFRPTASSGSVTTQNIGSNTTLYASGTQNFTNPQIAAAGSGYNNGTGTVSYLEGTRNSIGNLSTGNTIYAYGNRTFVYSPGAGTITNLYGYESNYYSANATNMYGMRIATNTGAAGTSKYGLSIGNVSGASSNYAIKTGTGAVDFGDSVAVTGDMDISGAYKISGTDYSQYFIDSAGSAGQVWTADGTAQGSWTAVSGLSVGNADTLDSLDSLQFLRSDTSDNYTSGTLTFDSGTTADVASGATLDINGNLSIADTDIALDGASTNFTATGDLSINSTNFYIDKSTGSIGINTNTPQSAVKLDVRGSSIDSTSGIAAYSYAGVTGRAVAATGYATSGTGSTYGIYGTSTGPRATGVNIGGYFSAQGAANNYALITGTGNVGIGTTTPDTKLEVEAGNISLSNGYGINIRRNSDGSLINVLEVPSGTNNIQMKIPGSSSSEKLGVINTGLTELFTILGSGNVGIGTATPQNILHLNDAGANTLRLQMTNSTTGTTSTDGLHMAVDNAGVAHLIQREAANLKLYTNNDSTTGITIDSSGSVGIGTATPPTRLAVNNTISVVESSGNTQIISLSRPSDHGLISINSSAGTTMVSLNANGDSYFNSGNLGIGKSTAVGAKLDVKGTGTSGDAQSIFNMGGTWEGEFRMLTDDGASPVLRMYRATGVGSNYYPYQMKMSTGTLLFQTGGNAEKDAETYNTDTLALTSTGRVGIGDTTPDHKLDVAGNIGLDADSYINWGDTDGTSGYGIRDNSGTIEYKASGGSWAAIGSGGGGGGETLAETLALGNSAGAYSIDMNNQLITNIGVAGTDFVAGGGLNLGARLNITGSADEEQLLIKANATQTSPLFVAQDSSSTELFRIDSNGNNNLWFGNAAGRNASTGSYNLAFGSYSLDANTSGYRNTAIGAYSLSTNNTGFDNLALGVNSLVANTTGNYNVAMGNYSLETNQTGSRNIGIGYGTLKTSTISDLVAIGYNALTANTTGASNLAIGSYALDANTTGAANSAIGYYSLSANISGGYNTAIGYGTLQANTASYNDAIGYNALTANTTGNYNVAFGSQALQSNTTGVENLAIGRLALGSLVGGSGNTAIGKQSLFSNVSGVGSTAIGYKAGYSENAGGGVYIGREAGYNETTANKLYIANSNTVNPLIYGEFDNSLLKVNGRLKALLDTSNSLDFEVGNTLSSDTYSLGTSSTTSNRGLTLTSLEGTYQQSLVFSDSLDANDTVFGISTSSDTGSTWDPALVVTQNGYVGIGTNAPTSALSIAGSSSIISNEAGDITIDASSEIVSLNSGSLTNFSQASGSSGTAAKPTFSFSTDGDTGMYNPDTNSLGFSVNATDAMRIIANGNVGIGVTSPGEKLEVDGSVNADKYYDYTNKNYYLDPAAVGTALKLAGNIDTDGDLYVGGGEIFLTPLSSSTSTTEGTIYYDSDTDHMYLRDGSAWHRLAMDMTKYTDSDTSLANGSYLEITHNQASNDLTALGWVYDSVNSVWKAVSDYSHTVIQNLQNQWNDATNTNSFINTESRLTDVELSAGVNVGTGADGDITVSSNTEINATNLISGRSCADGGDAVNYNITAFNAAGTEATLSSTPSTGCLSVGDEVLIINLQGTSSSYTNTGNWETLYVQDVSSSTVTFSQPKTKYYGANATDDTGLGTSTSTQRVMLQRVPHYNDVTVNSSVGFYATAWNGTKGGVIFFRANGAVTINGSISSGWRGYRGGTGGPGGQYGYQGESLYYSNAQTLTAVVSGGGAGQNGNTSTYEGGGGGGGSYGTAGSNGIRYSGGGYGGYGATTLPGSADLTKLFMGGGGGGGGGDRPGFSAVGGAGGDGGGITIIAADTITIGGSGAIKANGEPGSARSASYAGGGGGGAGGSVLIQGKTLSLGSSLVQATAGTGGTGTNGSNGGAAGVGRIAVYYADSVTGSSTPTYDSNYLSYRTYGLYHSPILETPNAIDYSNLRWEEELNGYGNIELQTRTGSASAMTADANTVGLWHLDESSGTSVADSSTSSNTGTASGAPIIDEGMFSNARTFDGDDDYVSVADDSSLQLTTALTVEAWVKTAIEPNAETAIVRKDTLTGTRYLYGLLLTPDGKINAQYYNGTSFTATSLSAITDDQWHHAAMTISGTTLSLYLDGIYQSSTTISGTQGAPTGELGIGTNPPNTSGSRDSRFTGQIDEVRISNVARSASEIAANAIQWEAWSPNASTGTCSSPNCTSLETEATNYYTNWTASGATVAVGDITRYSTQFEDDHQATAANLTKITSSTSGDYVEDTITNVDLSAYDYLTLWVYASQPGNTLKVGIGESAATEEEETITINDANTWQKIYWDISDIADPDRDAITKIRLTNLVSASNTIYLGYVHAEKHLTNQSGSAISSTPDDYFQYRVIFSTTNSSYQPMIENIAFTYNDGYKIEQADNNTVRLYNYTGEAQNLRLDVTVFGADLAEWYTINDDEIGPGDLVSITGQMDEYGVPILKKADKANDPMLIGAISTQAGTELGLPADNRRLLGLDGRIPVKMDPDSPALEKGDHLTSSDLPGYARKAKPGELSIGRAFQAWDADNDQKTVLIIINDVMATPSFGEKIITSLIDLSDIAKYQIGETWDLINTGTGETVDSAIALAQAAIGKLRVGRLEVDEIAAPDGEELNITGSEIAFELNNPSNASESALGKLLINNSEGETVASFDNEGNAYFNGNLEVNGEASLSSLLAENATVSGELYAESIKTNSIEANVIDGLQERLETAVASRLSEPSLIASLFGETIEQTDEYLEQLQNEINSITENSLAELEQNTSLVDNALLADTGFIKEYFEVNGSAYIGQSLAIEQNLIIGSGMSMGEGYIAYQPEINENSLDNGFTFAIQPSGKGRLSLMANLMTLDESGLVSINGDLKVAGALDVNSDLRVKGTLLTNIIKADNPDENIQIQLAQIASSSAEVKRNNLELLDENGAPVATFSAQGELALSGALSIDQSEEASISGQISNKSAGQASIATGQSEVVIKTARLTENSMIYITPLNSTNNQVLYVKGKLLDSNFTEENEAQFTVGFDYALDKEVKFNWWIVN